MNETREQLIDLCTRGVVPVENWHDRDSAGAQKKLGQALALLRAGCEFRFVNDPPRDESTIWIEVDYPGFDAFEEGRHEREHWDSTLFYIPTESQLLSRAGGDWY